MAEARAFAENAQALAEAHEHGAALAAWQRAYQLSTDPTLLWEIARLERELGHEARATHALELLLARGGERVSASHRLLATRQLQAASSATARVNIQTNVPGAELELESERGVVSGSGFVIELLVDAGERRLSLSKPGYDTRGLLVSLEPGEVRTLRVDLERAAAGRSQTSSSKPRWAQGVFQGVGAVSVLFNASERHSSTAPSTVTATTEPTSAMMPTNGGCQAWCSQTQLNSLRTRLE